jgi:hypothetical protein
LRDHDPAQWHPWLAWIDEDGVSALDHEDNEFVPPDAVRLWLEEQAREATP